MHHENLLAHLADGLACRVIGATFWTEIRQRRTAVAAELFAGRIFGPHFEQRISASLPLELYGRTDARSSSAIGK